MSFLTRLVFRRTTAGPAPTPASGAGQHGLQPLEDRTLFAAFTATSAADLIADINAANQTAAADTITLAPGATFQLTKVNNTVSGPTGLPVIKGTLTIVGNGRTIERFVPPAPPSTGGIPRATTPAFRLFDVSAGASLTLTNLTLRGGLAVTAAPASSGIYVAPPARGGAVHSLGTLSLQGVTVRDNAAVGRRGVSTWGSAGAGSDAAGGGVYSAGTFVMTGGSLLNNAATGGGGLGGFMFGTDYNYFPAGPGGHGYGGGLYVAAGTATITGSKVESNVARGGAGGAGGGGGWTGRPGGRGGNAFGGGVFAAGGVITLRTTAVTANAATGGPRLLYNSVTGKYELLRAPAGLGIGGAAYVQAPAVARIDAFSKAHITGNTASTSSNDLFGPYATIV